MNTFKKMSTVANRGKPWALIGAQLVLLFMSSSVMQAQTAVNITPSVNIFRDDGVATLELDYVPAYPWTPFDIGNDGLGPVGYRVSWRLASQNSKVWTGEKVTSLRRIQIQPLKNNVRYVVRVEYVNRFGDIVGNAAYKSFLGGDGSRVALLRQQMTGFFDDFKLPAGLPDERKWNTSFSKINDPALQGFFINSQEHTHTVVGTLAYGYGDRGQTTHRVRDPLKMIPNQTRRIVFDLDGVNVGARSIWYLDLLKEKSEMTSHITPGGGAGFSGHPSPGLRFSLIGQEIAVYSINQAGEQILLQMNNTLEWSGVQTFPNVRRNFEIQLQHSNVRVLMDGIQVLNTPLGANSLASGDYTVHWTALGYNTMKVEMPYYVLHWDNFGFDGPAPTHVVHNYRSQVLGTDYVQSDNQSPATVGVQIPDNLAPTSSAAVGEAYLVFTRQMQNWQPAQWSSNDKVTVGGRDFPIEQPTSSSNPPMALNSLINVNAPYSSYISLGTVGANGTAPLVQGLNQVTFRAAGCGFHNVHIEVKYPRGSEPAYTPPQAIHPVMDHHDLPDVGHPARITRIGGQPVDANVWYMNYIENFNAEVDGTVDVGVLVNGEEFYGPTTLWGDFVGASLAASGNNHGIKRIQLWIRPVGGGPESATLVKEIATNKKVGAPQFVGSIPLDTTRFRNGFYELFLVAEDTHGVLSIPDFGSVGIQAGSPQALNGFYFPIHITISN